MTVVTTTALRQENRASHRRFLVTIHRGNDVSAAPPENLPPNRGCAARPFAMPVTGDRIRPSGRVNQNVGPENPRRNSHRSDLGNRNALFVAAKPTLLHAAHAQRIDHDARREQQIPFVQRLALNVSSGATGPLLAEATPIPTRPSSRSTHIHDQNARNTSISIRPKTPSALNFTAHGNRNTVSTSNTRTGWRRCKTESCSVRARCHTDRCRTRRA